MDWLGWLVWTSWNTMILFFSFVAIIWKGKSTLFVPLCLSLCSKRVHFKILDVHSWNIVAQIRRASYLLCQWTMDFILEQTFMLCWNESKCVSKNFQSKLVLLNISYHDAFTSMWVERTYILGVALLYYQTKKQPKSSSLMFE